MKTALPDDRFQRELAEFAISAFRLELQPAYAVGNERDLFDSFLAGRPEPPTHREEFRAYYRRIGEKTKAGITVERVRLVDDPPTPYQQWTRYMDRWNIEAGETIHYLPRRAAADAGVTKGFAGRDWWLLDNRRLILMTYEDGRRTHTELTTETSELQQARSLRDLAIRTTRGES